MFQAFHPVVAFTLCLKMTETKSKHHICENQSPLLHAAFPVWCRTLGKFALYGLRLQA